MCTNTIQQAGGEIEKEILQNIHTLSYIDIVGVGDFFQSALYVKMHVQLFFSIPC